ncbi:cation:proton antiporter [Methanoregula sp.]|uniref:cation:proton antiporter n=1 Tax=Methanoregula sp. TaxID=2052170 RepID=UPI002373EBBA|nr:cation:proton antiporter [Methanoregula sp.]MDD1686832.1 cation:proton antiporter [Methanoregula sp.]
MDFMLALVGIGILSIILLYVGAKYQLPSIVSFLIIGMFAGPYGLAIITDQSTIETMGEIGIMLLLFTIGLEFSFEKLLKSWRIVIIGGLAQLCTTIVGIAFAAYILGVPAQSAIVFGFIISLSSTAIVMKILQERREVDTLQGRTLFGILLFQDLAIIPMLLITPVFMGIGGTDLGDLPEQITKVAMILILIIILAKWVIPKMLYKVASQKNRELFFITIAGICVIVAWLTNQAGLSYTLGAFVAGLIIGESDYNIDALSHIIPFRDIFAAIFFLSIGMLLDTKTIFADSSFITLILMIVILIIGIKILTGMFASAILGMPARVSIMTGFALCQVGEFSFVLAKTGLDANFIPNRIYQIFLAAAIVTMALTPFMMNAAPRVTEFWYRHAPRRVLPDPAGCSAGVTPERSLTDHIIIAGYGITGKSVARAAEITGIPYMVIELNPDIIRREKSSRRPFFLFGDAAQEELLEHAGIRDARALVVVVSDQEVIPRIVHSARQLAPEIYIIARTTHIRHAQYLLDLGADEVVSEEYEAAKEIFTRALKKYRLPDSEIAKIVSKLQNWGYAKFIKNGNNTPTMGMDTVLLSLRIHMLTVEPGSFADGKTIADLELKSRYGISDFGVRRDNKTTAQPDVSTCLIAGDALIIFATDQTAKDLGHCFSKQEEA